MGPTATSLLLAFCCLETLTRLLSEGAAFAPGDDGPWPLIKTGECPEDVNYPSCGVNDTQLPLECKWDSDCEGRKKCCVSGCRNRCLLPLYEKQDSCPAFDASVCASANPVPDECHHDFQCQGSERCCCFNCRRQCTPTEKVNPGICPPIKVKASASVPAPECETDTDCGGNKKCCDFHGKECWAPEEEHSGFCPISREQLSCISSLKDPLCHRDANCPQDEKCCLSQTEGRMECLPSLKEKPGKCPPSSPLCPNKALTGMCDSDGACPGEKKCCSPYCRMECTEPLYKTNVTAPHEK